MSKIPLIIDTDPGHDDTFAIMLALSSEKIDVKGITTVCGNSTVENTTNNAVKLLSRLGITNVPVVKGIADPMLFPLDREGGKRVHGESGLEGPWFPEPMFQPLEMNAVDFIAKVVKESKEKVVLAPLGPLCNIAAFILSYPELLDRIDYISLMGGSIYHGNVTPSAEYNVYVDPESAQVVFSSGITVVMHSIDSVRLGKVTQKDVDLWGSLGTNAGQFAVELMEFYTRHSKAIGRPYYVICDPHAIAYIIDPSIYTTVHTRVEVELGGEHSRGRTVTELRKRANAGSVEDYYNKVLHKPYVQNCLAVTDVNNEVFVSMLTESLKKLG